jgi:peptidoglycan/LPS O-acetylase OafA/YrhL
VGDNKDQRRVFHTLDGLRGVAAVFVAMRHTAFFRYLGIDGGYLAVDLFFVLSGFVIAHAYEQRLAAGLSAGRFMAARYLRLWPVYALGVALGLAAAALQALSGKDNLSLAELARTAPFALAMLPGPHIRQSLYPVNSVAWSLALELMVNFAYALTWRWMRKPLPIIAVLAASGGGLVAAALWFGKLDVGFTWANVWGGVPRVLFSFTAGLAVFRLSRHVRWRIPAWAPVVVLPPLLWIKIDPVVYPLACIMAVFPLLVLAAVRSEPGARLGRLFSALGLTSYPLYALHKPAGELMLWLLRHHARGLLGWNAAFGVPYLAVLAGLCLLIERFYDRPVRRALGAVIGSAVSALTRRLRGAGADAAELT